MPLFAPKECRIATDWLEQGNLFAAAEAISACAQPGHRAVRILRGEIQGMLIYTAITLGETQEFSTSLRALDLAERCGPLPPDAMVVAQHLRAAAAGQPTPQEMPKVDSPLDLARREAAAGRLRTALDRLASVRITPSAESLRAELQERIGRFQRYVQSCREAMTRSEWVAARQWLRQARALMPEAPEFRQLDDDLRRATPQPSHEATAQNASNGTTQIVRRSDRGVQIVGHAVILFPLEIVLGGPRDADVDLPLLGRIRRRHAVLARVNGVWTVRPLEDALVRAEGRAISSPFPLRSGDCFELGEAAVTFRFEQPVEGESTASLEPLGETAVAFPNGAPSRILLMDQRLIVAPTAPAHLLLPGLPCSQLMLFWKDDELTAELRHGLWAGQDSLRRQVCFRDRWTIFEDLPLSEWFSRTSLNAEPLPELMLAIDDPYARPASRLQD